MAIEKSDTFELLNEVEILSNFTADQLSQLSERVEETQYKFGDPIFNVGEPGKGLYIVKSGTVRVFAEDDGKEISMGVRRQYETFAETGAIKIFHHDSSARASADTTVAVIARDDIVGMMHDNPDAAAFINSYIAMSTVGGFVSQLFGLRQQDDKNEFNELVRGIGVKRVQAGEMILEQSSSTDSRLYVIREGVVSISHNDENQCYSLPDMGRGEVFGEEACLHSKPQPLSISAKTDIILLMLPKESARLIFERQPMLKEALEKRIENVHRDLERQKSIAERRNRPTLFDLWSKPRFGEKVIKRFPLVEQAEESDCGAACLAMICKYYDLPLTLGKLREMANVTTEGATLESLAKVGETLGFSTRGLNCTYESLLGFDLPFIAHWEGYHYITVYGVSKRYVWIADPSFGFKKMSAAEFEKGWTGTCLLFTPTADMAHLKAERSSWRRFAGYITPYKKMLLHLIIATLVIEVLGIFPPVIIQNILDHVLVHQSVSMLQLLIVGLIITNVFTQLTSVLRSFLSNYLVRNLDFTMMTQFFKHTLSLPTSFFTKRRTGDVFARFQENETIREFLTESTISTLLNVLMIFIYFIVLFMYNVKMTLLLIALVIPMVLLTFAITPTIKNYARRNFEASTDAEAVLMETIGAAETIKAVGIERAMRLRWEKKYAKALDVQYRSQRFEIYVGVVSQLLNSTATIVILWTGATLVMSQQLSVGQLIAFNMLMGSVMEPLMGLVGLWDEIQEVSVSMERLGDVLDLEPEQKSEEIESRVMLPDLRGAVKFENVYFRYGGSETPYVLQNINFEMNPGETVAIVGHSGSGKTTLAKLLVGFYPPTDGNISVDGYDLSTLDMGFYRPQLGYVMQSNLLFSGTIAENIALGEDNPDRRKIIEVAQAADAHGFISGMPLGYEQVVGERGVGLSGGQIQRLCIARALYRDPRLLILDEATASLDTQSEGSVMNNIEKLVEGRTVIVIAHRLSTVMNATKILVLYEGGIVECGPHHDLIERKGMYYQLVQKQMAGNR